MLNVIKKVWNSFATFFISYYDLFEATVRWLIKHWKGCLVLCAIELFITNMCCSREFVIETMKQTTTKIKEKVKKIFKK